RIFPIASSRVPHIEQWQKEASPHAPPSSINERDPIFLIQNSLFGLRELDE
ncbi:hypothetical protein RUM43_003236, partial [Polyplax serrata]